MRVIVILVLLLPCTAAVAQEKKSVWPKDCPVLIDGGGSMDGLRRNMAEAMKLDPRASWVEINTERDAGCPTLNKKK